MNHDTGKAPEKRVAKTKARQRKRPNGRRADDKRKAFVERPTQIERLERKAQPATPWGRHLRIPSTRKQQRNISRGKAQRVPSAQLPPCRTKRRNQDTIRCLLSKTLTIMKGTNEVIWHSDTHTEGARFEGQGKSHAIVPRYFEIGAPLVAIG